MSARYIYNVYFDAIARVEGEVSVIASSQEEALEMARKEIEEEIEPKELSIKITSTGDPRFHEGDPK